VTGRLSVFVPVPQQVLLLCAVYPAGLTRCPFGGLRSGRPGELALLAIVTDQGNLGEPLAGTRAVLASGVASRTLRARWPGSRRGGTVARIVVEVMLKPEIHDPQGEAISRACQRLGFADVLAVRQGKRFEVELSGTADEALLARMGELAGELLANPVIEEFTLHEG
jgi:phosphoribosylformylglycinamidine synthase